MSKKLKIFLNIAAIALVASILSIDKTDAYEAYEGTEVQPAAVWEGNQRPLFNNTYDFGSSSYRWANGYFQNINTINLLISGTVDDSDLKVKGNVEIGDSTGVASTTLSTDASGDFSITPDGATTTVASQFIVSGDINIGTNDLYVDVSSGRVGIATTSPSSTLDVAGDFMVGTSSSDKILTVDSGEGTIAIGGTLQGGNIIFPQNGGAVSLVNMQVTSAKALGSEMSYSFEIDDITVLKVYAESNGLGGIRNKKVRNYGGQQDYASTTNATAGTTTLGLDERIVLVEDLTTGIDLILPDTGAAATGTTFTIVDRKGTAATHNIRVTCQTKTKTISGNTTSTLDANYEVVTFVSDGRNWFVSASTTP